MKTFPPLAVLFKGLITFIPGAYKIFCKGTGGTISSRYCYSVWMRHLVVTQGARNGIMPKVVGELGPGDSIGIGLASLLSGVEKYFALDVVKHIDVKRNLKIFEELVVMFKNKERIPDQKEFPNIIPLLDNYDFPSNILTSEILLASLSDKRLEQIIKSISNNTSMESMISYFAPWDDKNIISPGVADMIFSQFVLEHVNDLEKSYGAMFTWLKFGGVLSNVIDFQCHGTSSEWNGHWLYSKLLWKLIVGGRPFLLNRQPAQFHIDILERKKFKVLKTERFYRESKISIKSLAAEYATISYDDLQTTMIYMQAVK